MLRLFASESVSVEERDVLLDAALADGVALLSFAFAFAFAVVLALRLELAFIFAFAFVFAFVLSPSRDLVFTFPLGVVKLYGGGASTAIGGACG